jgi:hypothetical protein
MAIVEITLTAEQLAAAYLQLSAPERRSFLEAVFSHPANQHLALELLMDAHAVLQQKFPSAQQRLLDRLLSKNTEGTLRPAEHTQLETLMAEYEAGLVEKARARYIVELSRHAAADDQ